MRFLKIDDLSLNLISWKLYFFIFLGVGICLKSFWVLILQIFHGKTNIVIWEVSQKSETSMNAPIGQQLQKFSRKNCTFPTYILHQN